MRPNQNIWADRRSNRTEGAVKVKEGTNSPKPFNGIGRHSMAEVQSNHSVERAYQTHNPQSSQIKPVKRTQLPNTTRQISRETLQMLQYKSQVSHLTKPLEERKAKSSLHENMKRNNGRIEGPGWSALQTPRGEDDSLEEPLQKTPKMSPKHAFQQNRPSIQQRSELNYQLIKNVMQSKLKAHTHRPKEPGWTETGRTELNDPQTLTLEESHITPRQVPKTETRLSSNMESRNQSRQLLIQYPQQPFNTQTETTSYNALTSAFFGIVSAAKSYITGDESIVARADTSLSYALGSSFQNTRDSAIPGERKQQDTTLTRLLQKNNDRHFKGGNLSSEGDEQPDNFIISSPRGLGPNEYEYFANSRFSLPANAQNSNDSINLIKKRKFLNQLIESPSQSARSAVSHNSAASKPRPAFDPSETPVPGVQVQVTTILEEEERKLTVEYDNRSDTTSPRMNTRNCKTQDLIDTILEQSSVCEDSVSTIKNQAEENMGIIDSFYDQTFQRGTNKMTPVRSMINTQLARNKKIIIHSSTSSPNILSFHEPCLNKPEVRQSPFNKLANRLGDNSEPKCETWQSPDVNVTKELREAFHDIFPGPEDNLRIKVTELPRNTLQPAAYLDREESKGPLSPRTSQKSHIFIQNRNATQRELSNMSKGSSQGGSSKRPQHIFKPRDNRLVSISSNARNSYILKQEEILDNTFLSEVEEYNRLLEGTPEPEQIAKKLTEEKNRTQIFSELQRLDTLARTLVEHEGYIIKLPQGKNARNKIPRRFWCQIRDKKLKFYKDGPQKMQLSGTIDFDLHQCRPTIDDPYCPILSVLSAPSNYSVTEGDMEESGPTRFRIEMQGGCDTVFIFDAQTYHDLQMWQKALFQNWAAGEAMTRQRPMELGDKFWKQCYVSLEMVNRCADSGDLILFAGNSLISQVSRTIQSSDYDHVAMFLRFSNGNLVYFESTADNGVQVYSWDYFVFANVHRYFKTISFRKLRADRNPQMIENLFQFVKKTRGLDYKLDLDKLIQKTCKDDLKSTDKNKTFFCSELVASCLKQMGVISGDKAANKFWPGCFAQSSAALNGLLQRSSNACFEDVQTILWPKNKTTPA